MKKITKPSKAQLESKIAKSVLLIERGNDFKAFRFSDIGILIELCEDYTIISSNFHKDIWSNMTPSGLSNVYVLLNEVVSIANEFKNEISVKNEKGEIEYHFSKFKDLSIIDSNDRNILILFEKWLYVLNDAPFMMGSEKPDVLAIIASYILWLSKNQIFFSERIGDMTANDFYNELIKNIRYMSFNVGDMSEKDMLDFKTMVDGAENNAFLNISEYLVNKGIEISDEVVLPKLNDEEAQAMALQSQELDR